MSKSAKKKKSKAKEVKAFAYTGTPQMETILIRIQVDQDRVIFSLSKPQDLILLDAVEAEQLAERLLEMAQEARQCERYEPAGAA
jgi:hypothetical protein